MTTGFEKGLHRAASNRKVTQITLDIFYAFYYSYKKRGNSSVVERDLAKVDVAGPTPVSRFIRYELIY